MRYKSIKIFIEILQDFFANTRCLTSDISRSMKSNNEIFIQLNLIRGDDAYTSGHSKSVFAIRAAAASRVSLERRDLTTTSTDGMHVGQFRGEDFK